MEGPGRLRKKDPEGSGYTGLDNGGGKEGYEM